MKINVSFIFYFCPGKYSFSLGTFWTLPVFGRKSIFSLDTCKTQLVFWWKLTFPLLFISVLVNTASVRILFEHSSYFDEYEHLFIVHFCFGNYSFSLDISSIKLVFWWKLTFHSLFLSVFANIVLVSKPFGICISCNTFKSREK